MARYFFHIKDGVHLVKDEEGTELADAQEAHKQAIISARELLANAIRSGQPLQADAVVVADEHGTELIFVPFAHVLPERLK